MKIAVNSMGVNGGGGKTYLENFLPALQKADPHSQYRVIVRPEAVPSLPDCGPQIRYVPAPAGAGNLDRMVLEQIWLPRWLAREKIDLLYSPADSTSLLAKCPVVLAMRNMNLYTQRDKGWTVPFRLKFSGLSVLARASAKIARKIIFVSHSSKEIISKRLGIRQEKQEVVYHGVSPIFWETAGEIPPELSWLASKTPYLLSVSSIYRYKNYVRLIEAFARFRKEFSADYHLIIAGKPFDKPYFGEMKRCIQKSGCDSRVHLAGEIPYPLLPVLYQRAALFVFPSYLETFGHPLVEAMASGVPVAAAGIENTREITNGAAVYFDPRSVDNLVNVLRQTLSNSKTLENLAAKGKQRAACFSWTFCAHATAEIFRKALAPMKRTG